MSNLASRGRLPGVWYHLRRIVVGSLGAAVGLLFCGFIALAPWHVLKLVLLTGCFLLGMTIFAGIALSVFGGEER